MHVIFPDTEQHVEANPFKKRIKAEADLLQKSIEIRLTVRDRYPTNRSKCVLYLEVQPDQEPTRQALHHRAQGFDGGGGDLNDLIVEHPAELIDQGRVVT